MLFHSQPAKNSETIIPIFDPQNGSRELMATGGVTGVAVSNTGWVAVGVEFRPGRSVVREVAVGLGVVGVICGVGDSGIGDCPGVGVGKASLELLLGVAV